MLTGGKAPRAYRQKSRQACPSAGSVIDQWMGYARRGCHGHDSGRGFDTPRLHHYKRSGVLRHGAWGDPRTAGVCRPMKHRGRRQEGDRSISSRLWPELGVYRGVNSSGGVGRAQRGGSPAKGNTHPPSDCPLKLTDQGSGRTPRALTLFATDAALLHLPQDRPRGQGRREGDARDRPCPAGRHRAPAGRMRHLPTSSGEEVWALSLLRGGEVSRGWRDMPGSKVGLMRYTFSRR